MKNLLLLFIAILFLHNILLAQEGWFWQNPLPQGNSLRDVYAINENMIIAVGDGGTIIKSTNTGGDWDIMNSGTSSGLSSVQFVNSNTGWAVGSDGTILISTDSGDTWDSQSSGVITKLNSVIFLNENLGWVVGDEGIILHTTDSGSNWEFQISNLNYNFNSVFFVNENIGFIAGGDTSILKTTNGGLDWFEQTVPSFTGFTSVFFINESLGWICDAIGVTWKTTNGGEDWIEKGGTAWGPSIQFTDSNTGWIAGGGFNGWGGFIIKTTDGGENWTSKQIVDRETFYSLHCLDANHIWAVGQAGIIYNTEDGGINWSAKSNGSTADFADVFFTDINTGYVVGSYQSEFLENADSDSVGMPVIMKTTNSGNNWETQFATLTEAFFQSVYFVNNLLGWVTGFEIPTGSGIWKTTNGGEDWINKGVPAGGKLFFINETVGWVINPLMKTTDGGETWFSQTLGTNDIPQDFYFTDNEIGWLVTANWNESVGKIFKSTDGGESWGAQLETTHLFYSIYFIDENTGWSVGMNHSNQWNKGVLYKTTNGGADWIKFEGMEFPHYLRKIYFIDSNNGWALGNVLLRTTNGGDDWFFGTTGGMSFQFVDENIGWMVGYYGQILKTTNGGVSFVEEREIDEIPSGFYLSNNFPDPFNPSTRIRYSVPQLSNIVIKVFDILGNQIETLVNEQKPMGTYEIIWYAENLPSGVYFYRLESDNIVETKKMILLK